MPNIFCFPACIWRQRSGSTLAEVMACCLTAPSHYLNQCWLIISGIHLRAILQEIPEPSVTEISLKITYLKYCSNLLGANELTHRCLNEIMVTLYLPGANELTHRCLNEMVTLYAQNFQIHFLAWKMFEFWLEFHWNLLFKVQMTSS